MKKTLHFEVTIDAPRREVWHSMLDSPGYEAWTSEFSPGSYFDGSWDQGAQIRFMDPSGSGVVSVIERNEPYSFISIRHMGMLRNGVEDLDSDEVRQWVPAHENYRFSDAGSGTRLQVEMDVTPEFEEHMQQAWPRALAKLKGLCESQHANAA